jgi:hypothetical protein
MATNTAVDAINRGASNARVRLAMLMGGMLESGLNPMAVGDNGKSHGIFQIYLTAHPNVTPAQAHDPDFSVRFMLPEYTSGVNRVDTALWNSNPKQAAALAAFYAERPKVMYPSLRIDNVWATVQSLFGGGDLADAAVNNVTGNTENDAVTDLINVVTRFFYDLFGNTINYVWFALLYGVGGLTMIVGFYLLLKNSTRVVPAIRQVGSGYRTVIGGVV